MVSASFVLANVLAIATCLPPVAAGGPDADFKSLFNKAFLEQLNMPIEAAGLPPLTEAASAKGPQAKGREGELDQQLQQMVGPPGGPAAFTIEFSTDQAPGGEWKTEAMRDLFPGPLQFDIQPGSGSAPFDAPDPLVMDMLSGVNTMMQEVMTPALHNVDSKSLAPASCQMDLATHCATARSQVHCLGQHSADVSDNCQKDVGKAVPYVCSAAIDKYCDILQVGILDCLRSHETELSGDCSDAVHATSKVITRLNSAKRQAPQVPPVAGIAAPAAAAERERSLDSKLAVLTPKAASVISVIKKAEQEAEDKLNDDASKISALLTQMSEEMTQRSSSPSPRRWLHENWRVVVGVVVLLVVAFFALKSDFGRMAISKLKLQGMDGKPLLAQKGTELSLPFDDGDVRL